MRTWQSTVGKALATIAGIVALSVGAPVVLAGTAGAATRTGGRCRKHQGGSEG